MNSWKMSTLVAATTLASLHSQASPVSFEANIETLQGEGSIVLSFKLEDSKIPQKACYLIGEQIVDCQSQQSFSIQNYNDDTRSANIQGKLRLPNYLAHGEHATSAKVRLLPSNEEATVVLPTIHTNQAKSNDFDYAGSVEGLTQQSVVYNDGGTILDGVMSSEEVIDRKSSQLVTGYVSEWAQYGRQFSLESIAPSAYGKLVYSFLGICGDQGQNSVVVTQACQNLELNEHEIVVLDMWGGLQSAISQRQVDMGWDDLYDGASKENYDGLNTTNVRGLLGQMLELKSQNPELKLSLSVGGWTLSEPFHRMAASPESRATFVDSVVDFVQKWGFDGVDIDWEYPGHGGESGASSPDDSDNYVKLIQDMRAGLDSAGLQHIDISSAVGATQEYIELIGSENYQVLAGANGPLDYVYLMNYDYWGAFTPDVLGHQTNLYGQSFEGENGDISADKAVELLKSYGVEASRIMLGVANYHRGKQGIITEPGNPSSAEVVSDLIVFGTHEASVVESYDLFANMAGDDLLGSNGFEMFTDPTVNADYYYNNQTSLYYSGDSLRTAHQKAKYAKEKGLAGVFMWTVEQDYNGHTVNSVNMGLGNILAERHTTEEQRINWVTTCGVNISDSECQALNQD